MRQDHETRKDRLGNEVSELRRQVAELQATTALCRQTQEALRQKTAFVELLKVVAVTSQEGATIESVMEVCLEQICKHLGWPVGHVYRVAEGNSQELVSAHLWYLEQPERFADFCRVTQDLRFAKGEGLPGQVMAEGKLLWIADLPKDYELPRARQAKQVGIKAGFGIPVLVGGEVTAVLEFFSLEEAVPDDQLLGVMAHIGTQLGELSERKRAEATRRDSEERYRAIIANIEDGYCEVDLKGNITFFNDAMSTILGYSAKELRGLNFRRYADPEAVPRIYQNFNKVYQTGESFGTFDYRILRKDGTPRFVESSATLIRDAAGQPVGFLGILRDITERKQTEEVLRQSEERYRTIIEEMNDSYWEMDLAGKLTYFNNQVTKLSQRSKEELQGITNRQLMDEEAAEKVGKIFKQIYLTGEPARGISYELIRADGTKYFVESNVSLITDAEGKGVGFRGVNRDVTERTKTEEVLRQSEERYRTIIEEMNDAYWEMDLAGKLTYFNDQLMELHGRSKEELMGLNYKSYMGEQTVKKVFQYYNQLYRTGEPIKGLIHEQYQGNGALTYVESNVSLIKDVEGKPLGFRGISRDVTKRKQTETALQESKDYLDRIINTIADPIFVIDQQHRFVLLNDAFCQFVGQTRETMIGKTVAVYCPPDEALAIIAKDNMVFANSSGQSNEDYFTDIQGNRHIILTKKTIYEAQDGEKFLVGVIRDITELKQTEEALRQSEERYRTIIEEMTDAYWEMDLAGKLTFFNNQMTKLSQRSREELLGLNNRQYMDEETAKKVGKIFKQIYLTGEPARGFSYELIRADGTKYFVESNVSLITDGEGKGVGFRGVNRDVTARKQAEDALKQSEERYRTIIEDLTEAYWEMDLGGTFTFCNHQLTIEQQRSREELLGLNNREYMDEETFKKVGKIFKQIYLSGEAVKEIAYEMIKGDGTKYSVESNVSLILDEEGKPVGFRGVNRDVTERKQAELELQRAKETAEAASRAKSEFLANMSHEIRTPINGILGMTELALDTKLSSEQREYLGLVKVSADALLLIINDILDFSKIEAGKLDLNCVNFNLRDNLDDILKPLAVRAHQKGLNLVCQVLPETPDALIGDAGRLRQILLNMVGNAVKFTDRGEITVRVEVEERSAAQSLLHFLVSDTGIGIPTPKQQIIFEAFSQSDGSTTRRYGGTGLGLTISSQLVEMMGGKIWVESQPELGSTFHFTVRFGVQNDGTVPVVSKPQPSWTPAPALASPKSSRGYHILLAEDNVVNQKLAVRLLEKRGHSVVVAENGRKAVAAFEKEPFDLILMDMQMPELNGYEATALIREKEEATDKHIPIIALTAHTMKGDRERCLAAGMDGYVSKPIKIEELFETIEEFAPLGTGLAKPVADEFLRKDVIDRQAILSEMDGDEELFREVAEMFLAECPPLLAKIQQAIAQSNGQELEKAAHKLKGSIATFEAKYAYQAALTLETMGRKNDLGDATRAGLTLTAEVERLQQALFNLR